MGNGTTLSLQEGTESTLESTVTDGVGIYGEGDFTVSGDGTVKANGTYGIFASDLTIESGTVYATGNAGENSIGLYGAAGDEGHSVVIKGGKVIASGDMHGIYGYGADFNIEGGEIQATGDNDYGALFVFNGNLNSSDKLALAVKGSIESSAEILRNATIYNGGVLIDSETVTCGGVKIGEAFCKTVHIKTAPAHKHCKCGSTENIGDHTTHQDVSYQPLDSSFTGGELSEGSYYLTEDITLKTTEDIIIKENVNLCLNGKNIKGNSIVIDVKDESAELNLTDCEGKGLIEGDYNLIKNTNGTTNMFDIAIKATAADRAVDVNRGEMNVYGGFIKSEGTGIVLALNDDADRVLNIYGGEITTSVQGVFANSKGVVNITGGTIKPGGTSGNYLADVTLNGTAELHLSGKPNISKVRLINKNKHDQQLAWIFAECGGKNYTGEEIQIQFTESLESGDIDNIIVSDVTQGTNDGKFLLDRDNRDNGYGLKLDGTDLVVARVTPSVTLTGGAGYTLEATDGSTSPVDYGSSFTFNFALAAGYSKTDNFAVKVNGNVVPLNEDGSYTISDITEDIKVTVEGVADNTAPTGEITVGTNKWKDFLNTITFGLFFKETQSVEITAEDAGSGVKTISYYLADGEKTEEDLKNYNNWIEYKDSFNITPDNKYVIYAKLEDKDGNTAYINTQGLVLDSTKPVIAGIEDGKTYCGKQSFTVTEENLGQVAINGTEASAADGKYTISPAEGEQTVVVTDKVGNSVAYTVTVNDGHTLEYMQFQYFKIIETCEICGTIGHEESAYLKVSDADYAGSPVENAEVEYSTGWLGGDLEITYENNDGAGQATASITKGGITLTREFEIRKGSQTAPTGIGKTDETIDGKADGKLTNVNATMEYRKDGETKYTPITGDKVENLEDGTYYVRYAGNDNYNASPDSDPVVIAPGRKINVYFVADNVTIATKQVSWNGSIKEEDLPTIPGKIGYDQTPPRWDKTLGDLTNIRTEQDVSVFALYTINSYNVPFTSGEGYTLEAVSTNPVNHGDSFTFKVVIAEGYSKTDAFAVRYNGSTITQNEDGSYTVTVLTDLVSPVVLGIADNTAPTGEITVGTNKWHKFLNNITFGLFFKETQSVEITAEDAESGVDTIHYYLAEAEMTLEEVKAISDWQAYSGDFKLEPNHKYIIYAKLTDKAGNVSYINSNGVVLDNILPAISGIANGKTYCQAVEVTVDEAYLDSITVNGKAVALKGGKFTVSPATGEQTIVVTDKVGNRTEMTITVNDGHTWGEYISDNNATCEVCGAAKTESIPALNETSKTGDNSNMWLWIALVLISGAGLTAAVAIGKKRKINR